MLLVALATLLADPTPVVRTQEQRLAAAPLSGRVIGPESFDPTSVEVRLWSTGGGGAYQATCPKSDGSFQFDPGPRGEAWLLVDDWIDAQKGLWSAARLVSADLTKPHDLELKRGSLVHGRTAQAAGNLLGPGRIVLTSTPYGGVGASDPGKLQCNPDGAFAFAGCPAGRWYIGGTLDIDPLAYLRGASLRVPVDGELMVLLPRPASVSGRVLGPEGAPLGGAQISVHTFDELSGWSVTFPVLPVEDDGNFRLGGLHAGRSVIYAHKEGYSPSEAWVGTLAATKPIRNLVLRLRSATRLTVRLDPATTPADLSQGFEYDLLREMSPGLQAYSIPVAIGPIEFDADGVAKVDDVPPGVYAIQVSRDEPGPRWLVDVRPGQESSVTAGGGTQSTRRVHGRLLLPSGEPCGGRWIHARVPDGDQRLGAMALTEPDGSFVWDLPIAADYEIRVSFGKSLNAVTLEDRRWIDPASSELVEITLPGTRIRGSVTCVERLKTAGSVVWVERIRPSVPPHSDLYDTVSEQLVAGKGLFVVRDLPAGRYRLHAIHQELAPNSSSQVIERYVRVTDWFDLKEGEALEGLDLNLEPEPTTAMIVRY